MVEAGKNLDSVKDVVGGVERGQLPHKRRAGKELRPISGTNCKGKRKEKNQEAPWYRKEAYCDQKPDPGAWAGGRAMPGECATNQKKKKTMNRPRSLGGGDSSRSEKCRKQRSS